MGRWSHTLRLHRNVSGSSPLLLARFSAGPVDGIAGGSPEGAGESAGRHASAGRLHLRLGCHDSGLLLGGYLVSLTGHRVWRHCRREERQRVQAHGGYLRTTVVRQWCNLFEYFIWTGRMLRSTCKDGTSGPHWTENEIYAIYLN